MMASIKLPYAVSLFLSVYVFSAPLCAWAWNGTLEGELSVNQTTTPAPAGQGGSVMGAGRVSYEDGLSLIATIHSPQREGLSQLSIRVDPEHFNQTLSLPGEGRLVTYQERDRGGALTLSASAYQGWLEVREVEGVATIRFELSVKMGDEVRSLYSGGEDRLSLSSIEGAIEVDEAVDSDGELIIGVIEGTDEGCDESSDDVYETSDDTGCDEGTDDWSEEAEPWDESTSEESASSDGCEDDEWAAEASAPHTKRARRRASPVFKLLVRLAPLWCSLLFIRLWRRRTLRLRTP